MGADQFLLTWNNHKANFASVFSELRLQGQLVDVTLLCDGGSFPAHRLVLAACSPYFASLFSTIDNPHPLIFLRDVKQAELEALLEFIYKGQVSVANSELGGLIKIAESLRIKGLGDVSQRDPSSPPPPQHFMRHNNNHHMTSSKNNNSNKRAASPSSLNDISYATSTPRSKKISRLDSVNLSTNTGDSISLEDSGITTSLSTPLTPQNNTGGLSQGMYLPDLTALLTAANSYTHGLAANFPALAAVSAAAAAELTARHSNVAQTDPGLKTHLEESQKLRSCLQKGKETLKMKSEKQEPTDADDEPSVTSVDLTGDYSDSNVKSETDCQQIMQQLYGNNPSVADMSSLISAYQQLLSSSAKENNAGNLSSAGNSSEEGTLPDFSVAGSAVLNSSAQDITLPVKDAKCMTCHLCGATIKHTANFRRHMKQHLNPRRFPCPWCSAAFGRKDNLKTHTRKHHPTEMGAQEGGVTATGNSSLSTSTVTDTVTVTDSAGTTYDSVTLSSNGKVNDENGDDASGGDEESGEPSKAKVEGAADGEQSLVIDEIDEEMLEEDEEED